LRHHLKTLFQPKVGPRERNDKGSKIWTGFRCGRFNRLVADPLWLYKPPQGIYSSLPSKLQFLEPGPFGMSRGLCADVFLCGILIFQRLLQDKEELACWAACDGSSGSVAEFSSLRIRDYYFKLRPVNRGPRSHEHRSAGIFCPGV
jgi:hypothetical protein